MNYFLSCDWGTSSFRLVLTETQTGNIHAMYRSDDGLITFADTAGAGAEVPTNRDADEKTTTDEKTGAKKPSNYRKDQLLSFLQKKISLLEQQQPLQLKGTPVVISGMASSSIGIKNLPYASLPLRLTDPEFQHELFPETDNFPYPLLLVSGVCSDKDVMRGEEMQLLGLYHEYEEENSLYLFPGTHSKHIRVRKGNLMDFKTFMTGELFQVFGAHTLLRDSISRPESRSHRKYFYQGVRQAQDENLLHSLFTIRARGLLESLDPPAGYEFLSGLLIGTELKELSPSDPQIILTGSDPLQEYYSEALDCLNIPHLRDSSPEERVLQGHRSLLDLF